MSTGFLLISALVVSKFKQELSNFPVFMIFAIKTCERLRIPGQVYYELIFKIFII